MSTQWPSKAVMGRSEHHVQQNVVELQQHCASMRCAGVAAAAGSVRGCQESAGGFGFCSARAGCLQDLARCHRQRACQLAGYPELDALKDVLLLVKLNRSSWVSAVAATGENINAVPT